MTSNPHNTEKALSRSVASSGASVQEDAYGDPDIDAEDAHSTPSWAHWARHAASSNGFGDGDIAPLESALSRRVGRQC